MWPALLVIGIVLLYVTAESVALQIIVYLLAFACLIAGGLGLGAFDLPNGSRSRSARRGDRRTGAGAWDARRGIE